jgi:hypothetical protein
MVQEAKSWMRDNSGLLYFLAGQFVALSAAVISIVAYSVRLEARVTTLEVRGSPHLGTIDTRLTVLEAQSKDSKEAIDRVVAVMTKRLNVNP